MSRRQNWDVELVLWAREIMGEPHVWGETDCGSLVRGLLRIMYGEAEALELMGPPWVDSDGARDAWLRLADVERIFGAVPIERPYLSAGDVVVLPGPSEEDPVLPRLGVCMGAKILLSGLRQGVHTVAVRDLGTVVVLRLP